VAIIQQNLTQFRVIRGYIGIDKFCTFTYVNECLKEKCPAFDVCTYDKRGQCRAKRMYLEAAYGPMERLMMKARDPGIVSHWVGQLLSAYLKLAKFEIKELSLHDPIYTTTKGDLRGHPIYEMIQKQQKLIVDLWSKSGMMAMAKTAGLLATEMPLLPNMDDIVQQQPMDGQKGYYDAMSTADVEGGEKDEEEGTGLDWDVDEEIRKEEEEMNRPSVDPAVEPVEKRLARIKRKAGRIPAEVGEPKRRPRKPAEPRPPGAPKRGPGRPRKLEESLVESTEPKRKPGRPKRSWGYKITEEEALELEKKELY
jgi:hypothetical protein